MHSNEYVHADVKGSNILRGYKDPSQVVYQTISSVNYSEFKHLKVIIVPI